MGIGEKEKGKIKHCGWGHSEVKSVQNVEGVLKVSEIRKCRSWSLRSDSVMATPRGYSEGCWKV